jgi:carbon-monoxide dehydrogenase small subunit
MRPIALTVNGEGLEAAVEPRTHLADFLRDRPGLTGTHLGCEHGICGACTLLLDGVPVRSCITYAVACDGAVVTTIEGLDSDEIATELRAAFSREHALQCGYCTPGMLISARDVVLRAERADDRAIRVAMSGNLCRCTGYVGIIRAITAVIESRRARGIAAVATAGRKEIGPAGSGHAASARSSEMIGGRAAVPASAATEAHSSLASDFKPLVSLTQSIVVHHPRAKVWEFFAHPQDVAACLPGASVSVGDERNVTGKMRIKVGPIAADFEGAAVIVRDPENFSGTIRGSGHDTRSSSATQGEIRYALVPEGADATRVDLTVGYTLTGPLAQFNRSALVQDIVSRLTRTFAQNLEARLGSPGASAPAAAELNAASLVFSVVAERIKAWMRNVFGRGT